MKTYLVNAMYLQLFADAGTLVNATGNFVNAYTGETQKFDANHTMDGELKAFYDTELLENARAEMYFAQFAKTQVLPENHGDTVEWRKWNTFEKAKELQEGVIPVGQKFGMSTKTGYIRQYGTYTAITDRLETRAYDDTILGATEEMGASLAETQETLIRDALLINTNVLFCDNINLADGKVVNTPNEASEMKANSSVLSMLTPTMVNKAVTKLKKDRVPKINGKYYAMIHPSVAFDLRESEGWIETKKYADPENIKNGEIGELHGCRFIENTFAPIFKDSTYEGAQLANSVSAGSVGSIEFTGISVGLDELAGKYVWFGENYAEIASNTENMITFDAPFNVKAVSSGSPIYITDGDGIEGGGATYATYFFGRDAFGIIDPEGGAAEMIIKDKSQIGGPLNQFSTIGYKLETNGATILYPERTLRVMSCSAYSEVDEAN